MAESAISTLQIRLNTEASLWVKIVEGTWKNISVQHGRVVDRTAEGNGRQSIYNQQLDGIKSKGIEAIHSASGTDKEHNIVAYRDHFVGINMHRDSSQREFESMLRTSIEEASEKTVDELLARERDSYLNMRKAAACAIIDMMEVQFSYGKIAKEKKILEFTMKSSEEMKKEAERSNLAETIIRNFEPIVPYYPHHRTHNESELKWQELANAVTANATAAIVAAIKRFDPIKINIYPYKHLVKDLHDTRDSFWLGLKVVC